MNRFVTFYTVICLFLLSSCSIFQSKNENYRVINELQNELKYSVKLFSDHRSGDMVSPRSFDDGKIVMVPPKDWTSGFFAGELWMMYELTGAPYWQDQATKYTLPLENEKWNGKTHDMGFKIYNSYGKAWKNTQKPEYRAILIQAAQTLSTRFDPKVGCIRSWDHNADKWEYPVIIDNMMNLELLFWAARETGNELFRNIAISHAQTTMKNHFRPDGSCYHVVDYNRETGEVLKKDTHQGYAVNSAWSRGQAWALYGYTMVYRETADPIYLRQAQKIADFILNHPHLPKDKIPYWDFDAPNIPNEPRDASAAAIIASALYDLSNYSKNYLEYKKSADQMLNSLLSSDYFSLPKNNHGFILKHSTGSKPHNSEVDCPIIYGDYYLLEAIQRKITLEEKQ